MGNGRLVIHSVQCQLNKLSLVLDYDEASTETGAQGAQLDASLVYYGRNDDCNDYTMGYIPLSGLACFQRRKRQVQLKPWSEKLKEQKLRKYFLS